MESKLDFVPDNYTDVTEFEKALKFVKMIEAFNEDEDVALVASNEIITDEMMEEVHDYIEKHSFKS
jgi:transcriptional/translational regulatory protein YebC/TACO1